MNMTKNMNCEYEQQLSMIMNDFIIVKFTNFYLFMFMCLYIRSFDGLECIKY